MLVGVTAQSVSAVEDVVTLTQLRVLVLISSRGPLNLNAVAQAMGVHPSNAPRACDRLVNAGLLDRRDSPSDRRNVSLDLTPAGRELVQTMVAHRRDAIAQVLQTDARNSTAGTNSPHCARSPPQPEKARSPAPGRWAGAPTTLLPVKASLGQEQDSPSEARDQPVSQLLGPPLTQVRQSALWCVARR